MRGIFGEISRESSIENSNGSSEGNFEAMHGKCSEKLSKDILDI